MGSIDILGEGLIKAYPLCHSGTGLRGGSSPPMDGDHRLIQQASFPVHLLWGRKDTVIPLAESLPNVQERLPRGEVHVIEECGHLPHMEQRAAFESLLFDGILGRG